MYGDDDRVKTLLESIRMSERLISCEYRDDYDYLQTVNYEIYEQELERLRKKAYDYLVKNVKTNQNIVDNGILV